MQNNNTILASQDIVGAIARRNNLSIDSFYEIAQTRLSLFEADTQQIMQKVKVDFELSEHSVHNLLYTEKEDNAELKALQEKREKNEKEANKIKSKLLASGPDMFISFVLKSTSFWILSFLTTLFMGAWTFIAWILVRRREVELTDVVGGIMKYFSSYANGVPGNHVLGILVAGAGWTFVFVSIYILMYKRNKLNKASRHYKRNETWAVISLICFEIFMTVYYAYRASEASLTNKQLFDSSTITILLESLPLIVSWLLWHFLIYKNWICNIRDKAFKDSGEVYLFEMKSRQNKLVSQITELERKEANLSLKLELLKEGKIALNANIAAFKKSIDSNILLQASEQKNYVLDFGQKWQVVAIDEFNMRGEQALVHDYEVSLKNVIKRIIDAIDKRAKECLLYIEAYSNKLSNLLKVLNPDYVVVTNLQNQRLPALCILSFVLFVGCAKTSYINEKPVAQPINLIIGTDLSNRFLQDADSSLFLPVSYDLSVIQTAFRYWERSIVNSYDQGIDVTDVDGSFSVLPVSLPSESKNSISRLGFCLELSSLPSQKRWEYLSSYQDSVQNKSSLLYETVLRYKPFGADTWAFFRDLDVYIKNPPDSVVWKNKLILLTDGYPYIEKDLKNQRRSIGFSRDYLEEEDMKKLRGSVNWQEDFKSNQMGFLTTGKTYNDLEVLVIGINEPVTYQASATEFSIIQHYWSDFFEGMGIVKYQFIKLNSPASEKIIHEFIKF